MANVRKLLQKSLQVARDIFRSSNLPVFYHSNNINDYKQEQSRRYKSGENITVFESKLENTSTRFDSVILLPNTDVSGRYNRRTFRDEKTIKTTKPKARENAKEERWGIRVPTQTLPANTHIYFTYNLRARDWIYYDIESEFPIDGYIVDESGLNIFKQGLTFMDYGGFKNQTSYRNRIKVPSSGNWYFIIDNPNNQNTAIHYQVN